MIKFFWPFCLIIATNSTFYISQERAAELAEDFESEIPGSVDWLYRWAIDEQILDELHAVVNGNQNMTSRTKPESVAFFLFFQKPNIDVVEFSASMTRVFGSRIQPRFLARQFFTIKSTITVPNWFVSFLTFGRTHNWSKADLVARVCEQVSQMRILGQIDSRDIRFSSSDKRLRGLIFVWLRFGLPSPTDSEPPAIYNAVTKEWTLSQGNQREVFRRLAILGAED